MDVPTHTMNDMPNIHYYYLYHDHGFYNVVRSRLSCWYGVTWYYAAAANGWHPQKCILAGKSLLFHLFV
jgi:hypothetical protein